MRYLPHPVALLLLQLGLCGSVTADPAASIQPVTDRDFYQNADFPAAQVELGRLLFFDKLLSGNRNISCASCHHPSLATGDGLALGIGEGGVGLGPRRQVADPVLGRVPRNATPLYFLGAREYTRLFHDGRVETDPHHNWQSRGERNLDQPLYAPARAVEHSPFELDNTGPWPKGKPLGISLARWFEAQGQGKYRCENGEGSLRLTFTRLVPEATYTLWHDFFVWPPTEPFIGTYDLPMGTRDGSESVFHTDAQGHAVVERQFKPCLQLSGEHLMSELAIAWHSTGETHGPLPGEFSTDTHVHMYTGLPKRQGI